MTERALIWSTAMALLLSLDPSVNANCEKDGYRDAPFRVTLEGTADARKDKIGNACLVAATFITTNRESCSMAQVACKDHDDVGQMVIADPWGSGEHTDIACPKFVELACSGDTDARHLTETCRKAITGETVEDPLFVSPISFACSAFVGLGSFGAAWSTSRRFPNRSTTTNLLSLVPGIVGLVGCALIPF